jgi:hypothetical protein
MKRRPSSVSVIGSRWRAIDGDEAADRPKRIRRRARNVCPGGALFQTGALKSPSTEGCAMTVPAARMPGR